MFGHARSPAAGAKAPGAKAAARSGDAGVPPPLPFPEAKGLPVLKDFVDEDTKLVRPFKGRVTHFFDEDGS